jgi:hypothetical protein
VRCFFAPLLVSTLAGALACEPIPPLTFVDAGAADATAEGGATGGASTGGGTAGDASADSAADAGLCPGAPAPVTCCGATPCTGQTCDAQRCERCQECGAKVCCWSNPAKFTCVDSLADCP